VTPSLRRRRLCTAALLWPLAAASGAAEAYPTRPVRLVLPFPAGGGTDLIGRTVGQLLAEEFGQPVVVDNKPGGGTVIGSDFVAKSAPDGYTLLQTTSAHAINTTLVKKLPYSTDKSFAPVALIGRATNMVVVRSDSPIKSVAELIARARAAPGKLTYGSSGNGTAVHLAAELFKLKAGVNLTHVPYKGAAPAANDLLGGQIDMQFATLAKMSQFGQSGRLRALAVTSAQRTPAWPDVPTVAESGVPGYEADIWYAMFAPAGTPEAVVMRINAAIAKVTQAELFKKRVSSEGLVAGNMTPAELARYVRDEEARWGQVIREGNITAE
jgi:tripartite-type tricarboxylate transporter receptor subunit TctC